ncbi:hypothetical protein NESM_000435000 [Novymonas esmeraldas]|uniref:Uncharacterized protein n=1 Tax=Novymonas esmeraldas TaxID=1808958 RepID=A0AAW0ELW8_9TRYP
MSHVPSPMAPARRSLRVSFVAAQSAEEATLNRTASQQYELSFTSSHARRGDDVRRLVTPRSPLYPTNIIPRADQRPTSPAAASTSSPTSHEPFGAQPATDGAAVAKPPPPPEPDAARGALLIYPKKIDNLRRFRMLFVGLLLSISSSTQGMHSIFGVLGLQQMYRFNVHDMAVVFLSGTAVGLFAFPFGALYDWFGPRVSVALGSAIASLGHLLLALTFGGYIKHTVTNCAVFYALICWGCYALNVSVLPAVLTHMPRDRGVPTGLLLTFSGLGASFFACLFRGFFQGNFEHFMWFMFAVTMAAGLGCVWYIEDAPYVVNRWRQRRITPRQQLRAYLVRNRYMSQLVPKRRYTFMTVVLILLNFYLTIQAVCVAYLAADVTPGKLRGIAIGAIVIVLLLLVLVIPLDSIDGLSEQDKQVIAAAKAKEDALRAMQEDRYRERHQRDRRHRKDAEVRRSGDQEEPVHPSGGGEDRQELRVGSEARTQQPDYEGQVAGTDTAAAPQGKKHQTSPPPLLVPARLADEQLVEDASERLSPVEVVMAHEVTHGRSPSQPVDHERPLVSVYLDGDDLDDVKEQPQPRHSSPQQSTTHAHGEAAQGATRPTGAVPASTAPEVKGGNASFTVQITCDDAEAASCSTGSEQMQLRRTAPSTYANPRVETINLCGEVYVVPVYQTTFLESLTYLDLWLIFYTTLCVWGVGLVMTGNWNIQIMVKARYGGMESKHYILFAAMSGVSVSGGRVFLGIYERVLHALRERTGAVVVPTLLYPITSVGFFLGMVLWIALPGDKSLITAYIIGPSFYGMSTSITFYVLGTIFDRDIGMHYGFCYLGGAIGFVLCYWCAWYLTYKREASPLTLGYCIGERRCMNRAVGIYVALAFSAVVSSYVVHRRYSKLVRGSLTQRRVIVPRVKRAIRACGQCASSVPVKERRESGAPQTAE